MLLSTSELFWVGLIEGAISTNPLSCTNDPDFQQFRLHNLDNHSSPTLYELVQQYAEICGLGRIVIDYDCEQEDCKLDVNDMHWGRNGELVEAAEIVTGVACLIQAAAGLRTGLGNGEGDESVVKRFDELLEEHLPIAYGYAPSTPDVLYGLKKSGRVVVAVRVRNIPKGIVRVVLKALSHHMDSPAVAFMALAAAGDPVPDWHLGWIPSGWSMAKPLQEADRKAAISAITSELIGVSREEPAYLLGRHVGRADGLLREAYAWLHYELAALDDKSINVRALDYIPFQPADLVLPESQGDVDLPQLGSNDADEDQPNPAELPLKPSAGDVLTNEWLDEVMQAATAAITQVNLGEVDLSAAHEGLRRHVRDARTCLEIAESLAAKLGIDTANETLTDGIARASAILEETSEPERGISQGAWLSQLQNHRRRLIDFPDILRGVVPLAFGELRLKELLTDHDFQGLTSTSLEGWSKLVENARSAVRDGLMLLKTGCSPYVVINAVQPTLETIVRAVSARHLAEFRGSDLGNMLHTLHRHAKANGDQELEVFAAVGLALRLPRNNAVHDAGRIYDKHDAAFFVNGLAVMMRTL